MSFLTGTISIKSGKFKKPFSKRTFVVLSIAEKLQRLKKQRLIFKNSLST
ncbi:hypothetical protein PEB0149_012240 [Bartonella apis]|uniref:Uncharacterized protein n=1 Tax=Bartonella apis TaxID=1686310 RepID=A0A1R0FA39_9HYPH|nr:hypothetical protein PEB0149_012240 [Bartonella apis]